MALETIFFLGAKVDCPCLVCVVKKRTSYGLFTNIIRNLPGENSGSHDSNLCDDRLFNIKIHVYVG